MFLAPLQGAPADGRANPGRCPGLTSRGAFSARTTLSLKLCTLELSNGLVIHAPSKALHSGHRLMLQARDIAEGTVYVGSYNFSSVDEYQQWLRAMVEHIDSLTIAPIGERVTVRDRHIIRTLVRKLGAFARRIEELFPSVSGPWCGSNKSGSRNKQRHQAPNARSRAAKKIAKVAMKRRRTGSINPGDGRQE